MTDPTPPACMVLTTTASREEAERLGRTLVEERLAACATLVPSIESIYRWEGRIESSSESLLLLKTVPSRVAALESRLLALHSYETPEFLVLPIESVSQGYLDWLQASVQTP